MHRTSSLESLQARDLVRRFPANKRVPDRGAQTAGALDTGNPRCHQARRRVRAADRFPSRGAAADLPHGLGAADEGADRDGCRTRRLHRSESVVEPFHGQSQHRPVVEHVHVRVEAGTQDNLLFALAAGDEHRQNHGFQDRCRRMFARESRELRGLPMTRLLDPGFNLTLRPMRYPKFYEMYRSAIKNTWSVEEIDFQIDLGHMQRRMSPADRHLIERLVAFFATGDSIVANNLVLSLYKHINSPEARMYLSRQLYEEALHVQFYLTLLDNYVPDQELRARAFAAIDNIPSIRRKALFCQRWTDSVLDLQRIDSPEDKRQFLLNLTCFASCIEGLFFFGAFAYVYFLRSRGLLPGLASGTNWVFRDESAHMAFAYEVLRTVRHEEPELFDSHWAAEVRTMIAEAVECEASFADDVLSEGVAGLTRAEMREYLQYVADQRLNLLGLPLIYGARNPFSFMDLQDVQAHTNFFERKVSAYQVAVQG